MAALPLAPAAAQEAYLCRFDVICTAGGCDAQALELEIARSDDEGTWLFRDAEDTGTEALALSPAGDATQVFVLYDPAEETSLVSLYGDGRAVYSVHSVNTATPPAQGFGACEEVTG